MNTGKVPNLWKGDRGAFLKELTHELNLEQARVSQIKWEGSNIVNDKKVQDDWGGKL